MRAFVLGLVILALAGCSTVGPSQQNYVWSKGGMIANDQQFAQHRYECQLKMLEATSGRMNYMQVAQIDTSFYTKAQPGPFDGPNFGATMSGLAAAQASNNKVTMQDTLFLNCMAAHGYVWGPPQP